MFTNSIKLIKKNLTHKFPLYHLSSATLIKSITCRGKFANPAKSDPGRPAARTETTLGRQKLPTPPKSRGRSKFSETGGISPDLRLIRAIKPPREPYRGPAIYRPLAALKETSAATPRPRIR